MLINNLISDLAKNIIGADIFATAIDTGKALPEEELREYLYDQKNGKNPTILDYTFGSKSINGIINNKFGFYAYGKIYNGGRYPRNKMNLYPVEENYLNSTFSDFYIPTNLQEDIEYPLTRGEKEDVVWSLFNKVQTTDIGPSRDKFHIISDKLNHTSSNLQRNFNDTEQIRILMPKGIEDKLSAHAGDTLDIKFYTKDGRKKHYRSIVRGLPKKIPGYIFMSYEYVKYKLQLLTSYDQAIDLIYDFVDREDNPDFHDQLHTYKQCSKLK